MRRRASSPGASERSGHDGERRSRGSTTSSCRSRSRPSTCAAASSASAPSIDTILGRHGYPDAVARVLGEAAALTVLLGSSLKFEGRFQLQTKSDGPIEMVVVDFDAPDRLRAYGALRRASASRPRAAAKTPRPSRPRHPRHDHRPGLGSQPLPGRRASRRAGLRGGGATSISGSRSRSRRGCASPSPSSSRAAATPIGPAA